MSYAEMLLAIVPAAAPTRKNHRATSCPAPISANVPYFVLSRLIRRAFWCVSSRCDSTNPSIVWVPFSFKSRMVTRSNFARRSPFFPSHHIKNQASPIIFCQSYNGSSLAHRRSNSPANGRTIRSSCVTRTFS